MVLYMYMYEIHECTELQQKCLHMYMYMHVYFVSWIALLVDVGLHFDLSPFPGGGQREVVLGRGQVSSQQKQSANGRLQLQSQLT